MTPGSRTRPCACAAGRCGGSASGISADSITSTRRPPRPPVRAATALIRCGCRCRRPPRARLAPVTSGRSIRAPRSATEPGGALAPPDLRRIALGPGAPGRARLRARSARGDRFRRLPLLRPARAGPASQRQRPRRLLPARLPPPCGGGRPERRLAADAEQPRAQPPRVRPVLVRAARPEAHAAVPSRKPAAARGEERVRYPERDLPDGPGFLDAVVPEPHPGHEAFRRAAPGRHGLVQPCPPSRLVSVRPARDPGAASVVDVRGPERLTRTSALAARLRGRLVAPAVDRRAARSSHLDVMRVAVPRQLRKGRERNPVPEMDSRWGGIAQPGRA